jgi:diguanylate cyclase (GGDEF)-like protein
MERDRRVGATRVLMADDNVVIRRLLAARLQAAGYQVAEAADGQEALDAFRRAPAQVVITDLAMPRLDGLALLAALRAHEAPPEVILLTGSHASDAEAAVQALRLGAHDYISKTPAAVEAVALAVERAAEKWRLREENARLVAQLRRASLTDALTGVGNRRAFDEALVQEVARARRAGRGFALILFDLDHFKRVNDTLGHRVGDEVLAAFAARLRSAVRGADWVFRYGGEEFAVLLVEEAMGAALGAAARIVATVGAEPFAVGPGGVRATCSAGVSVFRKSDDPGGRELVARSDAALYEAKRAGRNRAVAFSESPATVAGARSVVLEGVRC